MAFGLNSAIMSMQNGILAQDDFYINGVPTSKYTLPQNISLSSLFSQYSNVDPYKLVEKEISDINTSIRKVIGSDHVLLSTIANYFFEVNGKRIRPVIVFLVAKAINYGLKGDMPRILAESFAQTTNNESSSPITSSSQTNTAQPLSHPELDEILVTQRSLSEIAELIHTASLLHDDVLDDSSTRRGVSSLNTLYGNKLAILGGDFLLARASVSLARLKDPIVIELISTVLEHLVKGEIMQLKPALLEKEKVQQYLDNDRQRMGFENHHVAQTKDETASTAVVEKFKGKVDLAAYITKTYYKTASLIANSCKSVAVLAGHSTEVQEIAYEYGKNLGLAFQIVDDLLDVKSSSAILGKPAFNDVKQGVITAPVLFAFEEFPHIGPLLERKCSQSGDKEEVQRCILASNALEKTEKLAEACAASATAAILQLNPSLAQRALIQLLNKVLTREK